MVLKKIGYIVGVLLFAITLSGCGSTDDGEMIPLEENESAQDSDTGDYLSGKYTAEIDIEEYGKITVELDADVAPITVTNFVGLVKDGFYDGLTYHRVIKGFMMQGGDPLGTGLGGSENTIKGEFKSNNVENTISHVRGVISMARSQGNNNSASSQFFIVHEDSTFLDGDYAAFGKVIDGMDIVDTVCDKVPVQDTNGTVNAEDQPKITSIKIID